MRDGARVPAAEASAGSVVLEPGVLREVIQALASALSARQPEAARTDEPAGDRPLLDLEETAELLGVSRMTVARMADEGRLPSVVVRRGRVQKIRRIPRAFVDKMVAAAAEGAQVDLEEYAAAWIADQRQPP
jgi:excisionase family DNA binding protein